MILCSVLFGESHAYSQIRTDATHALITRAKRSSFACETHTQLLCVKSKVILCDHLKENGQYDLRGIPQSPTVWTVKETHSTFFLLLSWRFACWCHCVMWHLLWKKSSCSYFCCPLKLIKIPAPWLSKFLYEQHFWSRGLHVAIQSLSARQASKAHEHDGSKTPNRFWILSTDSDSEWLTPGSVSAWKKNLPDAGHKL